jgi:hypothetical protein
MIQPAGALPFGKFHPSGAQGLEHVKRMSYHPLALLRGTCMVLHALMLAW